MTHTYTLTLPLTYNTYDIDDDSSQFLVALKEDICFEESYITVDGKVMKCAICISCKAVEGSAPEKAFHMEIEGVVAASIGEARSLVEGHITATCKALSLMMNQQNYNRQSYHPRVEADIRNLKHTEVMSPEENESRGIVIGDSISVILHTAMDVREFQNYYHIRENKKAQHLLDEYYIALGTEHLSSKFFHLFSIIEFVEKEYSDLSGAERLLDVAQVKYIKKNINALFASADSVGILFSDAEKSGVRNSICSRISQITSLGRAEKLLHILVSMGIATVEIHGQAVTIDVETVKELIELRNNLFHGSSTEDGAVRNKRITDGVTMLMYICPGVIAYCMDTCE